MVQYYHGISAVGVYLKSACGKKGYDSMSTAKMSKPLVRLLIVNEKTLPLSSWGIGQKLLCLVSPDKG